MLQRGKVVDALRTCPHCGSTAVHEVVAESVGDDASCCLVRCAACEVWRGVMLRPWEAWPVERRLRRRLRALPRPAGFAEGR